MTFNRTLRQIAWWAAATFFFVFCLVYLGSYNLAAYAVWPTSNTPINAHGVNQLYPARMLLIYEGRVCIFPSGTFASNLQWEVDRSGQHHSYISTQMNSLTSAATCGIFVDTRANLYLFPLWVPLALIGIPFGFFTWRSRRHRKEISDGITFKWVPGSRSKRVCRTTAILVFTATLFFFPVVGHNTATLFFGWRYADDITKKYGLSDEVYIGICMAICLIVPFLVARASYSLLRWRRIPISENDAPLCLTCRFNLKGNTSGICPECGTPITIA